MFYITSSSTSAEDSESGTVAKKQRLESGLSELREKISSVGANKKVIPWYDINHSVLFVILTIIIVVVATVVSLLTTFSHQIIQSVHCYDS